jgi:hypothetical protein
LLIGRHSLRMPCRGDCPQDHRPLCRCRCRQCTSQFSFSLPLYLDHALTTAGRAVIAIAMTVRPDHARPAARRAGNPFLRHLTQTRPITCRTRLALIRAAATASGALVTCWNSHSCPLPPHHAHGRPPTSPLPLQLVQVRFTSGFIDYRFLRRSGTAQGRSPARRCPCTSGTCCHSPASSSHSLRDFTCAVARVAHGFAVTLRAASATGRAGPVSHDRDTQDIPACCRQCH